MVAAGSGNKGRQTGSVKMQKRWIALLMVIIAAAAAAGIGYGISKNGSGRQAVETPAAEEWYFDYMLTSYSSMGCLHTDGGYLYFLDAATGEDMLLCDDPACSHEKETCSAYLDALVLFGIVEEERLLLVTDYGADKYGELYLYEAALNGGGRKELAKLGDNIQTITGAQFTEDYIILSYYNQYDENMELGEQTAGIYVYDRAKGEGGTVLQISMWNALAYYPLVIDEKVYFQFFGYDMDKEEAVEHAEDSAYYQERLVCRLCGMNLKDGDNADNPFLFDIDDFTPMTVYGDTFLYLADGQLYAYHTADADTEQIGDAMRVIPGDNAEGIYLAQYNGQTASYDLYLYDESVTMLGSCAAEWNPVAIYGDTVYALYVNPSTYLGELTVTTLSGVLE